MSKKIVRVTVEDFEELLSLVQESHYVKDEPIPSRDYNKERLESSLNTPFQRFAGVFLYNGFYKKAAVLFYLLIKNHCLINGNKRMACIILSFFCFLNDYDFDIPEIEFYALAKYVSESPASDEKKCKRRIIVTIKAYLRRMNQ